MTLNLILDRKRRYGIIHVPIFNMSEYLRDKNFTYDYNDIELFETNMGLFKIIHYHKNCKEFPRNVTYVLFCPKCSKNGESTIISTYVYTKYKTLRFYLNHSVPDCPFIRQKRNDNLSAILFCDHCHCNI